MNVAVCVKQIPDPAVPGSLSADHTLDRSGKLILDESDSYGVEMALQLVDAAGGHAQVETGECVHAPPPGSIRNPHAFEFDRLAQCLSSSPIAGSPFVRRTGFVGTVPSTDARARRDVARFDAVPGGLTESRVPEPARCAGSRP